MFTRILVIFTLLVHSLKAQQAVELPPSFKICPKASPNLASCVKDSIEHLRPYLKNGDLGKGFKVVSIEPIALDDIHLQRGPGFFFHLNNIRAFKISNFKIDKLRINPENFHIDAILKIPNIEAFADYKINLQLGLIKLQGQGKVKGLIDEIKIRLKFDTTSFFKNGVEYKTISQASAIVKIQNLALKIKDLFPDPTLNQIGENLVNQNMPMFMPEIEKSVSDSLTKIAFQTANGIVEKIPFNQLLS